MIKNPGSSLTGSALEGVVWKKSSYSGGSQGQCVEVADLTATEPAGVWVRDSKDPSGPMLRFRPDAFLSFIVDVVDGKFDS